jgi:prepilin signal peptidase PulO-like enzyme (type II secretory pathway)
MRATSTWRLTVVALAIVCLLNAAVIASDGRHITGLPVIIMLLSIAAATALLVSLVAPVRRFTLFVAALALLLQGVDVIIHSPSAVALAWALAGVISVVAWASSMRYRWPDLRHLYRVVLI